MVIGNTLPKNGKRRKYSPILEKLMKILSLILGLTNMLIIQRQNKAFLLFRPTITIGIYVIRWTIFGVFNLLIHITKHRTGLSQRSQISLVWAEIFSLILVLRLTERLWNNNSIFWKILLFGQKLPGIVYIDTTEDRPDTNLSVIAVSQDKPLELLP